MQFLIYNKVIKQQCLEQEMSKKSILKSTAPVLLFFIVVIFLLSNKISSITDNTIRYIFFSILIILSIFLILVLQKYTIQKLLKQWIKKILSEKEKIVRSTLKPDSITPPLSKITEFTDLDNSLESFFTKKNIEQHFRNEERMLRNLIHNNKNDGELAKNFLFQDNNIEIYTSVEFFDSLGTFFILEELNLNKTLLYPFLICDVIPCRFSERIYYYRGVIETTFKNYFKTIKELNEIDLPFLAARINNLIESLDHEGYFVNCIISLIIPQSGKLLYIPSGNMFYDNFDSKTDGKYIVNKYPLFKIPHPNIKNNKRSIYQTHIKDLVKNDTITPL